MNSIINVENLTYKYEDKLILDKISFKVKYGEWVSISGRNGSGKTTLIKILTGLINTNSNIIIDNLLLNKKNLYEIRKNIGIVFDNPDNSFLCETIEDDLAFTLENLCYKDKEIEKRVKEIAELFNIAHLLHKSPNEISGGEKLKVSIAIALIHNPKVLILDEALGMIDEYEKKNILDILSKLHKEGLTIISVIHDISESFLSDKLIILSGGKIVINNKPLKVMEKDKLLKESGVALPFEIELSMKLKLYGLINKLIPDINDLVNKLW